MCNINQNLIVVLPSVHQDGPFASSHSTDVLSVATVVYTCPTSPLTDWSLIAVLEKMLVEGIEVMLALKGPINVNYCLDLRVLYSIYAAVFANRVVQQQMLWLERVSKVAD